MEEEDIMKYLIFATLVALLAVGTVIGQEAKPKADIIKTKASVVTRIPGRCHCGAIQYEAQAPIVKSSYCDCRGCQRASGTLQAPFVTVKRAGFKIVAGTPSEYRAPSGEKCDAAGTWHFCAKCGTQIYWQSDQGDELDIFAGTLDDTSLFQPQKGVTP